MKPAGGVYYDHVSLPCNGRLYSVKRHRRRISAIFMFDEIHPANALAPYFQLIHSRGAERICGGQDNFPVVISKPGS